MDLYFTKKELEYHLTTMKLYHKVKHELQTSSIEKAITLLRNNAEVVKFYIFKDETACLPLVFTKLAPNVYTPHRLAYQMVLDKEPVSIEAFEKKMQQVKMDWENYHNTPNLMSLA